MKSARLFAAASAVTAALILSACGGAADGSNAGGPTLSADAEKYASLKGDAASGMRPPQRGVASAILR